MKKIIVIESADELIDVFSRVHKRDEVPAIDFPADTTLYVGRIKANQIDFHIDSDLIQIGSSVNFDDLFVELCRRAHIPLRRPPELD